MTTIAKCAHCNSAFKIKDHLVGKAIRCPRCGEAFRVDATVRVSSDTAKRSSNKGKKDSSEPKVPSIDPLSPPATGGANAEFYDTHEDVDAIYTANVASAQQRKRQQQRMVLIACGSLTAILLIVGTVVAFQYAYGNSSVPLELADPRLLNTEQLDGSWRPYSDIHWGYTLRMPGEPVISPKANDEGTTLTLRDPQLGTMIVEFRKESHSEWNDYFGKVDRDEVFRGVPGGNVMKISSEVTSRTDSTVVHRYILVSKDSRLTKNVAVVQKFSVDGKTVSALWSGKREMLRSSEVLYFFSSIEVSGTRYMSR